MPQAGRDARHAVRVAQLERLAVALAAAGMDDGLDPRVDENLGPIGKREKGE